jgi:hypothetical protein
MRLAQSKVVSQTSSPDSAGTVLSLKNFSLKIKKMLDKTQNE